MVGLARAGLIAMQEPPEVIGQGRGVGACLRARRVGGQRVGSGPGRITEDRTALVVLSNRDPPAATTLFRKLREVLVDSSALKACAAKTPAAR